MIERLESNFCADFESTRKSMLSVRVYPRKHKISMAKSSNANCRPLPKLYGEVSLKVLQLAPF